MPEFTRANREGTPANREGFRTALAVGFAGAASLGLFAALTRKEPTPRGDDLIYEQIARHPFGHHTFPFGYRIGLPSLVHLLPFSHTASFSALALVFAAGAAAFCHLLMRELGAPKHLSIALALLMAVSPPFQLVALRHGRNTDIATIFFMMAATYFAVRRQYWPFGLTLLVGVVFREAVLFIIPLAYVLWARKPVDRQAAMRALATGAPAVLAYAALRLGIHTVGEDQVPGYGGSLLGQRLTVVKLGLRQPFQEARRVFSIFGPLWLVAPLALWRMSFARRGCVLVALCIVSMTWALDWGRMILLAAPVAYPAAAFVLSRRRAWRAPILAATLLLAVGYAVYMDRSGVQHGIIDTKAPPYPVR